MANKYRVWAAGEQITAANLIDYIQKNVVVQCDNTASLPDASTRREGMTAYDINADSLLIYSGGATTGWSAPWNLPWGLIGYANGTGASASIGASTTTIAAANSNFPTITYPTIPAGGASATVNAFNGSFTSTANRKLVVSVDVEIENTSSTQPRDVTAVLYAGSTATPTTAITFSRARVTPTVISSVSTLRVSLNLNGVILPTTATTYLRLGLQQTTTTGDLTTLSPTFVSAQITDLGPNGAPT